MSNIAYVSNTNTLRVSGLRNTVDGAYINDATMSVTVKDKDGNDVSGVTWPLSLTYILGTNGDYVAYLPAALAFVHGQTYTAYIESDSAGPPEKKAHWEFLLLAHNRTN